MSHPTPPYEGALRGNNSFLAAIIVLLVLNLASIVWGVIGGFIRYDDPWNLGYGNLVVGIMLLLNHIAFQYPRLGWKGKALKALAVTWLALGTGYIVYSLVPP